MTKKVKEAEINDETFVNDLAVEDQRIYWQMKRFDADYKARNDQANRELELGKIALQKQDEIKEILVDFETVFNKIDYETKRQLLIELIDYIEVDITPTNAKKLGNDVVVKNIAFNYN